MLHMSIKKVMHAYVIVCTICISTIIAIHMLVSFMALQNNTSEQSIVYIMFITTNTRTISKVGD